MKDRFIGLLKSVGKDLEIASSHLTSALLGLSVIILYPIVAPLYYIYDIFNLRILYLYHFTRFYDNTMNEDRIWRLLKMSSKSYRGKYKDRNTRRWLYKIIRRYRRNGELI